MEIEAPNEFPSCVNENVFAHHPEQIMDSSTPDVKSFKIEEIPPTTIHPQVSVISSTLSSSLQHQRNSIIMKLESQNNFGPSQNNFGTQQPLKTEMVSPVVSENETWNNQNSFFSNQQTCSTDMSSAEELEKFPHNKLDIFDQNYNAFDDIETTGFGSTDADLEEIKRRLELENDNKFILSDEDKEDIAKVVNDHDNVYFSVNFGEVLIKEMLMCSMFGVQVAKNKWKTKSKSF